MKKNRCIRSIDTIDKIADINDEALTMDGYDDCIIGICSRIGQPDIVAYSYEKVIKKLVRQGMTEEEAIEYHEYNQAGAYLGDNTPCFIRKV